MRIGAVWLLVLAASAGPWRVGLSSDIKPEPEVRYDPAAKATVSGTIQDVIEVSEPATLKGIHIVVNDDKRVIRVYLCPTSYLKTFDLTMNRGDYVHITGSLVKFRGADLVLARQLKRYGDILELRDEKGNPYWEDEILKRTGLSR